MAKVVFYCKETLSNIQKMEYYRQDIKALQALGHEVVICNRYRDIPSRFDLMFIWWWTYALIPSLIAVMRRRPSIITGVFNFDINYVGSQGYFGRPWYQRLLISAAAKCATANLFISKQEFKRVTNHLKLKSVHYFPCAIGNEYFKTRHTPTATNTILSLCWSGMENLHRKGVWDTLRAIRLLAESGRSVHLFIAGTKGDGAHELEKRISEEGLGQQVTCLGEVTQEQKLSLFASCNIYLQPSYYEGFGLASAEAAAVGCKVITCDVGEVRTVLDDQATYVEPGNIRQIADAIAVIASELQLKDNHESKEASRLQSKFSATTKTKTLRTILSEIGLRTTESESTN